ncbi:DUF3098 domain-containing protein [Bacteroidia bacterium]|nr:DUF3098 domain-containing protein [Bacteroidia bacterium]
MSSTKKSDSNTPAKNQFVFTKDNYMWMLIGLLVVIIGFVLMYGNEDIYDFRKTKLAPVVVVLGFAIEIFAIMKKPKDQ